jgi:hypothetical protein
VNRLAISALLAASLAACGGGTSLDSSLTIDNASSHTFIEINLSPTGAVEWGTDLLGADILTPGETLEASGI